MNQEELEALLNKLGLMGKTISVSTANRKYSGTVKEVANGTLHLEGDPLYRSVRICISHIEAII